MTASKWVARLIQLATPKGDALDAVEGIEHPSAPGLAVTPHTSWFGHFVITHIPTGKKVGGPYERAANAQRDIAYLSRCADWTREDVAQQIKEHGEELSGLGMSVQKGVVSSTKKRALVHSIASPLSAGEEWPWEGDDSPLLMAERILADPTFNPDAEKIAQYSTVKAVDVHTGEAR